MNFSPFSCPIFLGHSKARGRCSQGERVLYGRDLCSFWEEPGKQNTRSCRAQELARSCGPRKCAAEKDSLADSVRIGKRARARARELAMTSKSRSADGF